MTESDKEKLHQKLESKIENMLDKLIEADEDLENNGDQSSLKFSDDISSDDVNKNEEDEPFEKELFNTQFFQNEETVFIESMGAFVPPYCIWYLLCSTTSWWRPTSWHETSRRKATWRKTSWGQSRMEP